jgi:CheY-like chemotaxis protein
VRKILIADSSKASLVMTSEVFKDHYPGVQVIVARSSSEALELAKHNDGIDAFIIDYDLPDTDGAQTAFRLKKLYSTPVLITAFDRPEVAKSIESSLKQYADCQSWLKKPVNSEVVIAVVQRFCDGKIRTQKRVSCNLPVFAEILLENESLEAYQQIISSIKTKKSSSKSTKVSNNKDAKNSKLIKNNSVKKSASKSIPIYFCGVVEDCSLSGVKLKPSKNNKVGLTDWNHLLASMEFISSGSSVTLKLPSPTDIENGSIVELAKVLLISDDQNKQQVQEVMTKKKGAVKTSIATSSKGKVSQKSAPALSTLTSTTKKKATEKDFENRIQSLVGKVAWTSSESGEWCVGVEFENPNLSKRLFEAILSFQLKQQKNTTNQSVMKTSRAG